MLTTTLKDILKHHPCGQRDGGRTGFSKLLAHLGKTVADDDPLPMATILDSNGFFDALWCVRCVDSPEKKYSAWLALSFAEDVRHMMTDKRSTDVLDVTRRYLLGETTLDELLKARNAASAAAADAADDAIRQKQAERLRKFFETGEIV